MITTTNFGALMGAPVIGPDDEKIGTVGQVFVDPASGRPNWMTVHTGWFGRSESFVPLDTAEWDHERVHIQYGKEFIKDAPRIDTDGALGQSEEDELYRYYGMSHAEDDDLRAGLLDVGNLIYVRRGRLHAIAEELQDLLVQLLKGLVWFD